MSDLHSLLTPRAAFGNLSGLAESGGIIACDRDGLGIATVMVRKGRRASLAQRLLERFNIELPQGPYRTAAEQIAVAGTGPESWLATQEQGGNAFAASLAEAVGDLASVSDQSDGYAVLRLSGPRVRDVLAKLVSIDVHPRAFKTGAVAATVAGHIGATLWRLEDGADGSPGFEIAVFRSLAADFWRALSDSAAEFADLAQPETSQIRGQLGKLGGARQRSVQKQIDAV